MATRTVYICDGACGTEAEALDDREADQWGVAGIPVDWLEVTLVRWAAPVEGAGQANGATRREPIFEKAAFHSAECLTDTIAARALDSPPDEG